jgi:hypothetical protein
MFPQLDFPNDKLSPTRDGAFRVFYTFIKGSIPASTTFHITVSFGVSCGIFDLHAASMGVVGVLDQVVTNTFTDVNSVPIGSITTGTNTLIMTFIAVWDNAASGSAHPTGSLVLASDPSLSGSAFAAYGIDVNHLESPPGSYSATWTMGTSTMLNNAGALVSFLAPCAASNPLLYYALDDPNEVPTWVPLTNFVWDPPVKYGGLGITPPYLPERFYLNQNADVAIGRRIRVKVDFGSNPCNERDELISWAIFGKKYTEE